MGELVGGIALIFLLAYIAYELKQARRQARSDTLQRLVDTRLDIWRAAIDNNALRTAKQKIFEHELYQRDAMLHDIDELTGEEQRALALSLQMELVYFQSLFYQRVNGLIAIEQALPLDYIRILTNAPFRRHWKDSLRLLGHFPPDYVQHVDGVVKKYDAVERRMASDEDAEFEAIVQEVFDTPPPPHWLNS